MKMKNLPSGARNALQRGMASKESYDGFAAVVGVWWALRHAKRSEQEMIEALEHMVQVNASVAGSKTGEKSSADEARIREVCSASTSTAFSASRQAATTGRNGLLKYVMIYALTLLLQPLLTVVLSIAVLWQGLLWLFFS
jgi:hypothetical protein